VPKVTKVMRPLKNYLTSHCEEQSDVAIFYIFNELEIASHSFAMTEWPFFKGLSYKCLKLKKVVSNK